MVEQTERTRKHFEGKIPEETRQHFHAAREEFRKSVEGMVPPEFMEHRREARKEMLLAFRGLIDHAIQRMDEHRTK